MTHEITPLGVEAAQRNLNSTRTLVSLNLQILQKDIGRVQSALEEEQRRQKVEANYETLNDILKTLLDHANERVKRYGNFFKKTKAKKQWTYTFITSIEQYQKKLAQVSQRPELIDGMKTDLENVLIKFGEATKRRWLFFLPGEGRQSQGEKDYINHCAERLKELRPPAGLN